MSLLGKWSKVTAADPPMVKNGRIKTAEGQGARVRGVRIISDPTGKERDPEHEV